LKSKGKSKENSALSNALTVVLIRGNGTPRSFRLAVPELQRSVFTLGLSFLALVLLGVTSVGFYFYERKHLLLDQLPKITVSAPAPVSSNPNPISSDEQAKELAGLREELAKINTQLDQRQPLPTDNNSKVFLQFLSARNVSVAEGEALVKIQNAQPHRVGNDIQLSFELHNIDSEQKKVRGYIVALAKSPDFLFVYPSGAFSQKENIILNFAKGETFAISRFRAAQAIFKNVPVGGPPINYQILLFSWEGKLLGSLYLEGNS
jgi:hypothetical protein